MEKKLPIIEVTKDNFEEVWPSIAQAVKDATFVAVDCELSGLGKRSKINSQELDIRYQNLAEVAKSYAVIAFGLSCFSCNSVSSISVQDGKGEEQIRSHDYMVQTYNVLTMCSDPFTVDCSSLKFLLNHGFDFNKLYSKGTPYYKGCDRQENEAPSVRHIFSKLLEHRKPLIVHNGLIDLIFLYQSFYTDLPKKNDTFAADLDDLFPLGVYDTKYLAEFHLSMPATYLEYLFKKMQLKNASRQKKGEWHVRLQFPPYPQQAPSINWHSYLQIHSYSVENDGDERELCQNFALHGFCTKREVCPMSHNINRVVKVLQTSGAKKRGTSKYTGPKEGSLVRIIEKFSMPEEQVRSHKRKRLSENKGVKLLLSPKETDEPEKVIDGPQCVVPVQVANDDIRTSNGHRAGFDAFMTGYAFASAVSGKGVWTSKDKPFTAANIGLVDQVNKMYLMGKNIPFLIRTGTYANMSAKHCNKIVKVRNGEQTLKNV